MFPGLLNNLSIKTVPSKERNFQNIVFIDTPGLADGNLKYKFDVEAVYKWFAKHCDIVFVFLDPIGQALCAKTNALVNELISQDCAEVRFIMTKGDMFRTDQDRAKCMCQIT
jgi:GTPase Era involved in 16S rRNA processing